jgi:hypothetical protein
MSEREYINASEVAAFLFCKRSWFWARQDKPSLLEEERARGVRFHQQHSDKVQAAPRARSMASRWAIVALILLALCLLWALR